MAGVGMTVPIMLPLEITVIICGALGVSVKFRRRKLMSKAQKHYKNKTTCRQQVKFHLKFNFQIHKRWANTRTGIYNRS